MTKEQSKAGFTLIELMIVIAIIGILAAIAIPNFIAYRNKSFCTGTEADAAGLAAAVADYFAIPTNTATPTVAQLNGGAGYIFTGANTGVIVGADPNVNITIQVRDGSGRCPADYTGAVAGWTNSTYTKRIRNQ
ncbi:MAG: prepilin-type N-terminal cleavage/methylation domain-containing protein [Desulfobacter sp.]